MVITFYNANTMRSHFLNWKKYFEVNQQHFDAICWEDNRPLEAAERKRIHTSIRQFQRGEHSEGKHFLAFAGTLGDPVYTDIVRLFIREEQDHAGVLGRFMDLQQIRRIRQDGLDTIFRRLRKLAGLECTVSVLLTAEIISMIYYQALEKATGSKLLQQICRQILRDEEMHLRFQSYTLQVIYGKKNRVELVFSRCARRVLMAGTIFVVWFFHRKVLKAGPFSALSFFRAVWKEFRRCDRMISGMESNNPVYPSVHHAA